MLQTVRSHNAHETRKVEKLTSPKHTLVESMHCAKPHLQSCFVLWQRGSKKDKVFVAITSALTWARTNSHPAPTPAAVIANEDSTQGESHSLTGRLAQPDANTALDQAAAALAQHSITADAAEPSADEEEVIAPEPPVDLTAADADKRMATASSRGVLEAERTILAATSDHFKTYVVCPGLLYGMDAMPMWQLHCQMSARME